MKCSRCGYENPVGSEFCSECGASLSSGNEQSTADQQSNYTQPNYAQPNQPNYGQPNYAQPNQPNYGQPNYAQPNQPNYGQPNYAQPNQPNYGQPNYAQPNQPNYAQPMYAQPYGAISHYNRWAAFFLCLFLGVIGIHRFYVGKIGTGVLYIFTGGLFGIGALVDLIMIACGSFTDQYGAFLKE